MYGMLQITRRAAPRRTSPPVSLTALVRSWRTRIRERRALAAMDERLLRDIGISRLDAARECAKPFWQD
jgi:uncharacterized protein YjiS (DUF1127 family)